MCSKNEKCKSHSRIFECLGKEASEEFEKDHDQFIKMHKDLENYCDSLEASYLDFTKKYNGKCLNKHQTEFLRDFLCIAMRARRIVLVSQSLTELADHFMKTNKDIVDIVDSDELRKDLLKLGDVIEPSKEKDKNVDLSFWKQE